MRFKRGGKYLARTGELLYIINYMYTKNKKSYYHFHRLLDGKAIYSRNDRETLASFIIMEITSEMEDKILSIYAK